MFEYNNGLKTNNYQVKNLTNIFNIFFNDLKIIFNINNNIKSY